MRRAQPLTRAPRMRIETSSERRISRQLESAEPPYGWLPLAPDLDNNAQSDRAVLAWAFGNEQSFGAFRSVVEFLLIAMISVAVTMLVLHNAPQAWQFFSRLSSR